MQDAGKNFSNSIVIGSELGSPTIGGMNSSGVVTYTGSVWSHNATPTVTGYNLAAAGGGTVEFSGSRDFNDPLFINRPDGTTPVGGTVVLSGTSTSTGPISVMGGTLSINQDNRLGASGSTAGKLTLDGATLKLTAPVAPLNAFTSSRGLVLGGGGATIDATSHPAGSNPRFSGPISGSGNLTLKASGGFDLTSPANTYVGTTTIIGCTVNISSSYAFGAAGNTVVLDGGTLVGAYVNSITSVGYDIELGAAGGFFAPGNGRSMKVDGTIKGSGSLTKMGPGKLVLAAGSIETYSGDTRAISGTLSLGGEFMEGTGSQTPGADSGVSLLNSTVDMNAADSGVVSFASLLIAIEPATYVFGGLKGTRGINMPSCFFKVGSNHQNTTYAGTLSGPAKLIKIGTGTLTLTGVNAHGGNTEVSAGTLRLGVAETLPDAGAAGSTGGILDLGGHTETVRLGGLDAGSIVNGTLVATQGFALKSGAASAVLAGAGPLEKSGSGVATLTGINTYTGATTVSAGTLALSGSGSIAASSNYIVNGTLDVSATPSGLLAVAVGKTLSGSGTVAGGVTVSGTVAPGGNSPGTLSTGSVTLTGTYACEITGTACDVLAVTGDFTTGATTRLEVTGTPTANRYVIATCTGSLGSLAFADSPVLPGGYDLQVDLANKQLLIVKTGATSSSYAAWSAGKNLVASVNDGVTQDPDGDGRSNILEFALGGDPLAADAYLSPVVTLTADHFIFTFNRSDASEQEVALDFQSGSDLATWTEVAIGTTSAGSVGVVENGEAPDTVTVTLALSNQAGATLLCRLKAALKVDE